MQELMENGGGGRDSESVEAADAIERALTLGERLMENGGRYGRDSESAEAVEESGRDGVDRRRIGVFSQAPSKENPSAAIGCHYCGYPMRKGDKFCGECGRRQ